VEVTRELLDSAARAGACKERLSKYKPGVPLAKVRSEDLQWIEEELPTMAAEVLRVVEQPNNVLWGQLSLSKLGDGSGSGSGDGSGYGYGSGDGSGSGSGSGYGSGDGSGSGSGYGDGYGSGYGDGYGSGRGEAT
jgi:hypothetical protein